MSKNFTGQTAVITGAGSGLGLEVARMAAQEGMNLVIADIQADALALAEQALQQYGVQVQAFVTDVAKSEQVLDLARKTQLAFGTPHLVFNNAGVGSGGLIWETSEQDWQWVLGVNLMGVVNGVRSFTPMMLQAARLDPHYRGYIVNTASMAGLVCVPNMGVYNVSKHAVVALSETLFHDLALVTEQVRAAVLCPYFVPTGISRSERNRNGGVGGVPESLTPSQQLSRQMMDKAVSSAKVSAAQVAVQVFDALRQDRFYIYSHPKALQGVSQRFEDLMAARNPRDPYADAPQLAALLRNVLAGESNVN